jgi:hypothetical protein
MERERRTSWTDRPRPHHASAHGASATLRVATFVVSPALLSALHVPTSSKIAPSTTLTGSAVRPAFLTILTGLPKVRPGGTKGSTYNTPFLTGSGSQTEFVVTHSKQRTGTFLTGARTVFRLACSGGLKRHVTRGLNTFLTETARHSEIAVTHSKQTTAHFLTETRITHYRPAAQRPKSRFNTVLPARILPLIQPIEGGKR